MNKALAIFLFERDQLFLVNESENLSLEKEPEVFIKEGSVSTIEVSPKKKLDRRVLVISERLNSELMEFLYKIFSAVKISQNDILVLSGQELEDFDLSPEAVCREIVVLGDLTTDFFKKNGLYLPVKQNGFKILFAHQLSVIEKNADNSKRKLWESLKQMFQVG